MSSMRPASSAIGMKTPGGSSPRVGWSHRTSASTATTVSVRVSTIGWYARRSSSWSQARRRSAATSTRTTAASCWRDSKSSKRFLPRDFAVYIARSASRRICSLVERRPPNAIPMLTVETTSRPPMRDRTSERVPDALGELTGGVGIGHVLEQDRELVTAEPRRRVAGAQAAAEALGRRHEEPVTGFVAERVVHGLEVVDVEEQDREALGAALRPLGRVLHAVAEPCLVRQAGELVVERPVHELVLEALALGEVAEAPDPADHAPVDPLRDREALEHAAVAEVEHVVALGVRAARRAPRPCGGTPRDRRAGRARTVSARSSSRCGEDGVVQVPHLGEPSVEARDVPVGVDHEDAVGGRVERGVQQRRARRGARSRPRPARSRRGPTPRTRRRWVVEQVHDRELERDARRRARARGTSDGRGRDGAARRRAAGRSQTRSWSSSTTSAVQRRPRARPPGRCR